MDDNIIAFEEPEPIDEHDITIYQSTFLDVESAVTTYRQVTEFVRRVLTPEIDYGAIPGTPKLTLHKPGAEKMRRFFSLYTETRLVDKVEQWGTPITPFEYPLFSYDYETVVKDKSGNIVGTCEGNCNSYETKYHWRWVQAVPPSNYSPESLLSEPGTETEFAFAIEKAETTGQYGKPAEYWQSWQDDIASGKAKPTKRKTRSGKELDAYERDGTRYRIPNDNIYDQVNTIKKMSQKRSFVGAILLTTGASEFFTQDLEDYAQQLKPEEVSIRAFVPSKDTAARKLIAYVRSRGVNDPGEYIRATLEQAGMVFSLDEWAEILNLLDDNIS